MGFLDNIQRWVAEPPPEHIFEISEQGLAQARPSSPGAPRVERMGGRALQPSPSAPNIMQPQPYRTAISQLAGAAGGRRRSAALVIPDYSVRMTVVDFQEFPATEAERLALLRFRLRKSVPFHIDEAQVSYSIQTEAPQRVDVLAVAIARPILEEYEALFLEQGFRVGLVVPSSLAAQPLFTRIEEQKGLSLVAKLAGSTISVLLSQHGKLRLMRSLDLTLGETAFEESQLDTVMALLQQSTAYAEDEIGTNVERIVFCGFDERADMLALAERELQVPVVPLRSRFGMPTQETAGALGLLERYAA